MTVTAAAAVQRRPLGALTSFPFLPAVRVRACTVDPLIESTCDACCNLSPTAGSSLASVQDGHLSVVSCDYWVTHMTRAVVPARIEQVYQIQKKQHLPMSSRPASCREAGARLASPSAYCSSRPSIAPATGARRAVLH